MLTMGRPADAHMAGPPFLFLQRNTMLYDDPKKPKPKPQPPAPLMSDEAYAEARRQLALEEQARQAAARQGPALDNALSLHGTPPDQPKPSQSPETDPSQMTLDEYNAGLRQSILEEEAQQRSDDTSAKPVVQEQDNPTPRPVNTPEGFWHRLLSGVADLAGYRGMQGKIEESDKITKGV